MCLKIILIASGEWGGKDANLTVGGCGPNSSLSFSKESKKIEELDKWCDETDIVYNLAGVNRTGGTGTCFTE